jgi:hypothetical protein
MRTSASWIGRSVSAASYVDTSSSTHVAVCVVRTETQFDQPLARPPAMARTR